MNSKLKKIMEICLVMALAFSVTLPAYAEPDGEKTISPSQPKNANCQKPKKFITDSGDVIEEAVYGEKFEEINISNAEKDTNETTFDGEKSVILSNPVRKQ